MVIFGQSGCESAKVIVFGQSGCIGAIVVYWGKVVVFGKKRLHLG